MSVFRKKGTWWTFPIKEEEEEAVVVVAVAVVDVDDDGIDQTKLRRIQLKFGNIAKGKKDIFVFGIELEAEQRKINKKVEDWVQK